MNLALNSEMIVEMLRNQSTEALANPATKNRSVPSGRVALKAPSIMEPSMSACGLNHVTTHAVVITLPIGMSTLVLVSMVSLARMSPRPIQRTIKLPTRRIAISSSGDALMMAPIPKKHAMPRVTSKKITINAVAYTLLRRWVSAVLITKRF